MADTLHNAAFAAVKVAKALALGQPVTVSKPVYAKRINACGTCVQLAGKRCRACGCVVEIKARLATEQCPLGKW